MTGQRKLFDELFPSALTIAPLRHRRGRNSAYVRRRNTALLLRYYYHVNLCRRSFSDAVAALEDEFYLSPTRIVDILNERYAELSEVVSEQPDIRTLRERLPYYEYKSPSVRVVA